MAAQIGIKTADKKYFPVLDTDFRNKKKRLLLTTVRDEQENVQIDLYKGESEEFQQPEYIGTLLIDNIKQTAKGEAEIELILGIDRENNLNAKASDLSSGEYQSLSVSLESLEEDLNYSMPDFNLSETGDFPDFDTDLESELEADIESEEYSYQADEGGEPSSVKERTSPLLFIGYLVLSLAILGLLVFLIFESLSTKEAPQLQAERNRPPAVSRIENIDKGSTNNYKPSSS